MEFTPRCKQPIKINLNDSELKNPQHHWWYENCKFIECAPSNNGLMNLASKMLLWEQSNTSAWKMYFECMYSLGLLDEYAY